MFKYRDVPLIQSHYLKVADGHELYIEECGNPQGIPIVFLHGGPGGSITEKSRVFFDPDKFHLILFDQRGTGKSRPFLSLEDNTIFDSVQDMEAIRQYFNLEDWYIFGGSYGSTLALAYAIAHPDRVRELILRGIFLGRQEDVDWLFEGGAGQFYPSQFEDFQAVVKDRPEKSLVQAYYAMMTQGDQDQRDQACKVWSDWESGLVTLIPEFNQSPEITDADRSLGLLEAHYFAHGVFGQDDNYILDRIDRIQAIPTHIVHGRYDVDCRPSGAYDLHQAHPHSHLQIVETGAHSPYEKPIYQALVKILDGIQA